MKFDTSELGNRIRMYRGYRDMTMTQGQLSEMVGVNITTIVKYEDGSTTPGADKVYAIADALRCTPNDLLGHRQVRGRLHDPGRGQGVRHRGRPAMHAQRSARLEIAGTVAAIR